MCDCQFRISKNITGGNWNSRVGRHIYDVVHTRILWSLRMYVCYLYGWDSPVEICYIKNALYRHNKIKTENIVVTDFRSDYGFTRAHISIDCIAQFVPKRRIHIE